MTTSPPAATAAAATDLADRVRRVLAGAPVFDGHNDLAWELRTIAGYDLDVVDIGEDQRSAGLHTDLPRLRQGGVGAQFWSVWVPPDYVGAAAVTPTLEQIDAVYGWLRRYPDRLAFATSAADVERAVAAGKVASLLGVEGGHCIDESLGVLRMLYALGVRYLTLTHIKNVSWADSATDKPVLNGLNDFGRDVVREMNRLGMLVDLSHVAATTMHDALDVSTAPAFFSHSSAYTLCSHPRNVPDDVLLRVRDSNGIVMVTFVPGFLNEECHAWMDAMEAEQRRFRERHGATDDPTALATASGADMKRWLADHPRPPCDVADVADHVEHVRQIAGVDHVGLGGDYDGIATTPDSLDDVSCYPALLAELANRGWSDDDLGKLTYRNVLRVIRDTEAAATH